MVKPDALSGLEGWEVGRSIADVMAELAPALVDSLGEFLGRELKMIRSGSSDLYWFHVVFQDASDDCGGEVSLVRYCGIVGGRVDPRKKGPHVSATLFPFFRGQRISPLNDDNSYLYAKLERQVTGAAVWSFWPAEYGGWLLDEGSEYLGVRSLSHFQAGENEDATSL